MKTSYELAPPPRPGTHTVTECDEVLSQRADLGRVHSEVTDAWLDERLTAMTVTTCPHCGRALTACVCPCPDHQTVDRHCPACVLRGVKK